MAGYGSLMTDTRNPAPTTAQCATDECDELQEFIATSPSGAIELRFCLTHAEPAEALGWTVTDLDGQQV